MFWGRIELDPNADSQEEGSEETKGELYFKTRINANKTQGAQIKMSPRTKKQRSNKTVEKSANKKAKYK